MTNWSQFTSMPQAQIHSDIHCVTRWSQLDMNWEGFAARDLVRLADPLEQARFVTLHGFDDYTAIEFHERDRPGFWEVRGYHNDADPWKEERFGFPREEDVEYL